MAPQDWPAAGVHDFREDIRSLFEALEQGNILHSDFYYFGYIRDKPCVDGAGRVLV